MGCVCLLLPLSSRWSVSWPLPGMLLRRLTFSTTVLLTARRPRGLLRWDGMGEHNTNKLATKYWQRRSTARQTAQETKSQSTGLRPLPTSPQSDLEPTFIGAYGCVAHTQCVSSTEHASHFVRIVHVCSRKSASLSHSFRMRQLCGEVNVQDSTVDSEFAGSSVTASPCSASA